MSLMKIIAATAIATSLGAAALGLGAGSAQADPGWGPNIPWIPGPGDWVRTWTCGRGPETSRNGALGIRRPVTGLVVPTASPAPRSPEWGV